MEEKHIHFKQENVYGDKYDIHDNPGAVFNFGGQRSRSEEEQPEGRVDGEEELVEELAPLFFEEKEVARKYLRQIRRCKPVQVVAITKEYLKERAISDVSCHTPLWSILHSHGLYSPTLSNWNNQINS